MGTPEQIDSVVHSPPATDKHESGKRTETIETMLRWGQIVRFFDTYVLSAAVYVLVGGASALVEWSSFFVLRSRLNAIVAAIVAFFIATAVNYALSRGLAFRSMRRGWSEAALLFALSAVAFVF